ncbi:MAG TPA: DUF2203 domain-containing protein [Polyangiaceae bacterium]
MSEPQVFTLEAVNAMIPRLSEVVGTQLGRRSEIEKKLFALAELLGEVPDEITIAEGDSSKVRDLKLELIDCIAAYQEGWREVEAFGAVVKDTRIGLLDFYGRVDGSLVWLCWKYGEPECAHYHALDEGFAARRDIGASVRQRLLN